MKSYDVRIQFSGKEHSGKTSVMVLVADYLTKLGCDVTIQMADPQIDEKIENLDKAKERAKTTTIHLSELNTFF